MKKALPSESFWWHNFEKASNIFLLSISRNEALPLSEQTNGMAEGPGASVAEGQHDGPDVGVDDVLPVPAADLLQQKGVPGGNPRWGFEWWICKKSRWKARIVDSQTNFRESDLQQKSNSEPLEPRNDLLRFLSIFQTQKKTQHAHISWIFIMLIYAWLEIRLCTQCTENIHKSSRCIWSACLIKRDKNWGSRACRVTMCRRSFTGSSHSSSSGANLSNDATDQVLLTPSFFRESAW